MGKGEEKEALLVEVFDDLAARFILTCPVEEFSSFDRLFFQIEAAHWCSLRSSFFACPLAAAAQPQTPKTFC